MRRLLVIAVVVFVGLLVGACSQSGDEPGIVGFDPVRSELPADLATMEVTSGRRVIGNATEQRTDLFVIEGDENFQEDLERWIGCLDGGGEVLDISRENGAGISRFIGSTGFVAASEWSAFEFGNPVVARSFKLDSDTTARDHLWVLQITGFDVSDDPCPFTRAA